jgi:hypothetical protein
MCSAQAHLEEKLGKNPEENVAKVLHALGGPLTILLDVKPGHSGRQGRIQSDELNHCTTARVKCARAGKGEPSEDRRGQLRVNRGAKESRRTYAYVLTYI